jgi:hypothetical protein
MTNRKQTKARRADDATTSKPKGQRGGRWRNPLIAAATVAVIGGIVGVLVAVSSDRQGSGSSQQTAGHGAQPSTGRPGPEGIPLEAGTLLAPPSTAARGQSVDGIQCDSSEQVAYHVHAHLSVYVDGRLRPLPAGVGVVAPLAQQTPNGAFYGASRCYYWLHVHAQDGVIHIESPTARIYTLGQFFDIWRQPLSATQVGSAEGTLTVFVNDHRYQGDPRAVALGSHVDIQIDIGAPAVPPQSIDWSATGL